MLSAVITRTGQLTGVYISMKRPGSCPRPWTGTATRATARIDRQRARNWYRDWGLNHVSSPDRDNYGVVVLSLRR